MRKCKRYPLIAVFERCTTTAYYSSNSQAKTHSDDKMKLFSKYSESRPLLCFFSKNNPEKRDSLGDRLEFEHVSSFSRVL